MRLLRSDTLDLEEFNDAHIPPYAILSHTWEPGEEVTLGEIQEVNSHEPTFGYGQQGFGDRPDVLRHIRITDKSGYDKITCCCETARKDGFAYVWVDTCCIDKTSSAELSEAINSMYRWYQRAEVCYVYLSDVSSGLDQGDPNLNQPSITRTVFMSSRWFTRGWTLQELIAPASVIFYNQRWQELGTKFSLRDVIYQVTGIHVKVLLGADLGDFSVAQRMSWASKRQTTRLEDATYCLMGIFGVNMPMLYGEGDKAFTRLQEEIIRNSNDHSILVWSDDRQQAPSGILAPSPAAFAYSENIVQSNCYPMSIELTNKGVHLLVEPMSNPYISTMSILNCEELGKPDQLIAICLERVQADSFLSVGMKNMHTGRRWITVDKPKTENERHREDAYVPQTRLLEFTRSMFSYIDVCVELKAFQGAYLEVYPNEQGNWAPSAGQVLPMARPFNNTNGVAAIRLSAGFEVNEDFVVLLERREGFAILLSAKVFLLPKTVGLVDAVLNAANKDTAMDMPSNGGGLSDRVVLQLNHRRISVVIKRKLVALGARRLVVEIGSIDLPEK
jgi:hypothetical protein